MKIKVIQKNIEEGVPGACNRDPVALALRDAGFYRPWVSPFKIETLGFNGGFMHQEWSTPPAVLDFMFRFDNGGFVEPFEFELEGL